MNFRNCSSFYVWAGLFVSWAFYTISAIKRTKLLELESRLFEIHLWNKRFKFEHILEFDVLTSLGR